MPDAHIESKAYIQLGNQRIPVQLEYAPVVGEPPISPATLNRSLVDLRNTTIKATGTLTPAGIELFNQLWDHEMSEVPVYVHIDTSGLERGLKMIRRIRASLSDLEKLAHRYSKHLHRSKLRQRRKHRAMFRRKKRGLA